MDHLQEISIALDEILVSIERIESDTRIFRTEVDGVATEMANMAVHVIPDTGINLSLTNSNNSLRLAISILIERFFDIQVLIGESELRDRLDLATLRSTLLAKLQRSVPASGIVDLNLLVGFDRVNSTRPAPFGWDTVTIGVQALDSNSEILISAIAGFSFAARGTTLQFKRVGVPVIEGKLALPPAGRVTLIRELVSEMDERTANPVTLPLPNPLSDTGDSLEFVSECAAKDAISLFCSVLGVGRKEKKVARWGIYNPLTKNPPYFATLEIMDVLWESYATSNEDEISAAFIEVIRRSTPDYFEVDDADVRFANKPIFWGGEMLLVLSLRVTLLSFFCRHTIVIKKLYLEVRRFNDQEIHDSVKIGLHYRAMEGGSIDSRSRGDIPSPTCPIEHDALLRKFNNFGFDEAVIVDRPIAIASKISHYGWPLHIESDRLSLQLLK